jgi:hypothetical protein
MQEAIMRRLVQLIALFLVSSLQVFAQADRATLTGVLLDPAGKAVPSAKVTLTAVTTGVIHIDTSNSSGVYTFSSLPVGQYTLVVDAPGFEAEKVDGFSLEVGTTRTLNIPLHIGSTQQEVQVAATPDLDISSAVVGGTIEQSQTQALPVNGRYWASLESLIPGAVSSGTGTQDTIRFSGLSQEDQNFRLDGVDATGLNHAFEKAPLVVQFPLESIAEIKVSSALYSADTGGMSGGQINMASKGGTNSYHGSFYEYLRNSFFDAKAFNTQNVAAFRMNNFGASSGGPILRNRMFYFANFEAVRQAFDQPFNAYVPTDAYRAQVIAKSPALKPFVDAFPEGTQATNDPNALLWFSSGANPTTETGGLGRLDYTFSQKTAGSLRFNTDSYSTSAPGLAQTVVTTYSTPNTVVDVTHNFSPSIFNDAKVGFNRQNYDNPSTGNTSPYTLTISPNFSYSLNDDSWRIDNSYSFLDDISFYRGRHTIKAGVEVRLMQENKLHPLVEQSLTYNTETDFINNALLTYTYKPSGVETAARKNNAYGYIQDEYKVRPDLTLNFGLRFEYYGVDREKNPSIGRVFDPFTCGLQYCPQGSPFYYPNTDGFEPRISIGWAPNRLHNKTAIRAGYGRSFDDGQFGGLYALQTQIGQLFSLSSTTITGLSFPVTPYLSSAKASLTYSASDQHRNNLQVNQWTLSVQQELATDTILTATYVGSRGTHLFNNSGLLNGVNPATGTRPFASLTTATVGWTTWDDNSSYNALQVGLRRNMYRGLLASANYQYSHVLSDGSNGGGESDALQNNNCRPCEWASTDFDVTHNFTGSAIWNIPVGRGHDLLGNASPLVDQVLGGWQFSGIGMAHTGFPLNVTLSRAATALPDQINSAQRPNRVPGVPLYTAKKTPAEFFNPAAFTTPANGEWGNVQRNMLRGPGISQADMGMQKQFPIREQISLMFRADVFNVFNFRQLGAPSAKWTATPGTYGQITSAYTTNPIGTGTPRQMQFSLRLSY